MTKYMRNYEAYILKKMQEEGYDHSLLDYHLRQIQWLQHERLVHLIVLCLTVVAFLMSFVGMLLLPGIGTITMLILLSILTFAYMLHYYRLENTVQRWYRIGNTLQKSLNDIGTNEYNSESSSTNPAEPL